MQDSFEAFLVRLTAKITDAYTVGVTLEEAEKLACEFLAAQIEVAETLRDADLDSRMKKSGVKAVRAAVYMEAATKGEKKPSDVLLEAHVNMNDLVAGEQRAFDEAEVERDRLQNYLNIFRDAHIHFRAVAKGRFE